MVQQVQPTQHSVGALGSFLKPCGLACVEAEMEASLLAQWQHEHILRRLDCTESLWCLGACSG